MTAAEIAAARSSTVRLVIVLGSVNAIGPLSIDMYLPAFPEIARSLHTSASAVQLTLTEHRLLSYIMANQSRVLTRAQILDHVWDYDFGGDARVLETYISYLRKKLDVGAGPALIQTVRGVGYALRLPRG